MVEDIPLSLIIDNPFNSRKQYDQNGIYQLAESLRETGLLNPVSVRRKDGKFELVFGHRRSRAARLLNWKSIRAEIVEATDEQMLQISLVENLHRENLSDFETALSFKRLCCEFGKTYEQVGQMVGLSKSHVSNFMRMAQLFDDDTMTRNPDLAQDLYKISEHHARVLAQIPEQRERVSALRIAASENLSVRDLQKMIQRLQGWFSPELTESHLSNSSGQIQKAFLQPVESIEMSKIRQILEARFGSASREDFKSFTEIHDWAVYSLFTSCPPFDRYDRDGAALREKELYGNLSVHMKRKIRDVKIQLFGSIALVTLRQERKTGKQSGAKRGTIVFRKSDSWKIIHEHWSRCEDQE